MFDVFFRFLLPLLTAEISGIRKKKYPSSILIVRSIYDATFVVGINAKKLQVVLYTEICHLENHPMCKFSVITTEKNVPLVSCMPIDTGLYDQ